MSLLKPLQPRAISGTVINKTGTAYRVRTAAGGIITATSSRLWPVGSGVTVLSGEIIGAAGKPQPATVYEV